MLKILMRPTCAAVNSVRLFATDIRYGNEARATVQQGVDVMADAVSTTMGPKGRTAIIERVLLTPQITKDGITVANAVLDLKDRQKNLGAQLLSDVANNTNNDVGDGTTMATVLARAIVKGGFELVTQGVNPHEIRTGILLATQRVCERLTRISRLVLSVEQFGHVALVATNGDEQITKLIKRAFAKLGRDGIFVVEKGTSANDELEITRGIHFDEGYLSPYFVNSSKAARVEYSNARLLLVSEKINSLRTVLPVLELARNLQEPLVIVADSIEDEALSAILVNNLKLGLQVCAVKAPSFGNGRKALMDDIAVASGAKIFDSESTGSNLPLAHVEEQYLGKVRNVVITKDRTLFQRDGGKEQQIEARVVELHQQLKTAATEYETNELRQRLARLTSGLAIIRVGRTSDVEVNEKKDRITDALSALRAATHEGIVPGGGTAYLRCVPSLTELRGTNKEQNQGIAVVSNALRVPCMTIARNAGVDGGEVVERVLNKRGYFGYDAMSNEYCNLLERGIVDPTAVVRSAIVSAAGIASLLITTEAIITEAPLKVSMPKRQNIILPNKLRAMNK